jgi:hypothetical protein
MARKEALGEGWGSHSRCTCTLGAGRRGEGGGGGIQPRCLAAGCQQGPFARAWGRRTRPCKNGEGCQHSSIHLLTTRGGEEWAGQVRRRRAHAGEAQQARSEQVGWIAAAYERGTKERRGGVMGSLTQRRREGGESRQQDHGGRCGRGATWGACVGGRSGEAPHHTHARCWQGYKCWVRCKQGGKGGSREPGAAGKRGAASRHGDRACRRGVRRGWVGRVAGPRQPPVAI